MKMIFQSEMKKFWPMKLILFVVGVSNKITPNDGSSGHQLFVGAD